MLIALTSEVGELAECYRWLNEEELQRVHSDPEKKKKIEAEIADIMSYILMICYKTNIDLLDVLDKKIEKNKSKYPIDKSKGVHSNPLEGFKGKGGSSV